MQIALFGATGFVGTALTLRLLDQGHHITALSRKPDEWAIQHKDLTLVQGDISDVAAVSKVLAGAECAYYLVHGLQEEEADFEFIEARGAVNFVKAAIKAKLRKVIYLGGLGPEGELSPHLRSRQLVGDVLGLMPGSSIEFRASIVLGAQSTSFEMIKAISQRLPVRPYAPWLETPCQPIALPDLIKYLLAALETQVVGHTVIEVGAPEVVSYGDLLDMANKIDDVSRPKFLVPQVDQRLLYPLIDVMIPEFASVGKKLFLSLTHPTVVTDNKAEELFPDIKPRSVEVAMREAFAESSSAYPAVWEGDFWKELRDQTLLQTRQGQQQIIEKLKNVATPYQEKILAKLPGRKKKNDK